MKPGDMGWASSQRIPHVPPSLPVLGNWDGNLLSYHGQGLVPSYGPAGSSQRCFSLRQAVKGRTDLADRTETLSLLWFGFASVANRFIRNILLFSMNAFAELSIRFYTKCLKYYETKVVGLLNLPVGSRSLFSCRKPSAAPRCAAQTLRLETSAEAVVWYCAGALAALLDNFSCAILR